MIMDNSDIQQIIARNIKRLRKEAKLTQENLADALGYERSRVTKMELGIVTFSEELLINLCKALKCEPNELYSYEFENDLAPTSRSEVAYFQSPPPLKNVFFNSILDSIYDDYEYDRNLPKLYWE